jgi:BirA family biotin operon repressor/biotin-[acetyl-CoA-carboxylase] ligase
MMLDDTFAVGLARALGTIQLGLRVEVAQHLPSTNGALLERARTNATVPDPCLLVALEQSAGRGRLGRVWQATAGDSLTFSLGLPLAPMDWSGLSLAVGVAITESLQGLVDAQTLGAGSARLGLKWPNDIWLVDTAGDALRAAHEAAPFGTLADTAHGSALNLVARGTPGRKLGGILIETVACAGQRWAVIGVGLNVATPVLYDAQTLAAGLREMAPLLSPAETLRQVAPPLLRAVLDFERQGFAPFAARFAALDVLQGCDVRTTHPEAPEGLACGVDERGALRVQTSKTTSSGTFSAIVCVGQGEVSVRSLGTSAAARLEPTPALVC